MTEEYLDIVDENGNSTGEKELRIVCHEKGLRHNVAVVYFFRKREDHFELLVHLRSKFKDQNPNKWALRFGGHVESGKTIQETVVSEIREEVGISISLDELKFAGKFIYNSLKNNEVAHMFFYEYEKDLKELSFNDGEVQEVKWVSLDEIERSMKAEPEIWSSDIGHLKNIAALLNK